MVDTFSTKKRREIMQSVRRELTAPEETLAQLLDKLGCDYARNVEELPGKPDIVLGPRTRRGVCSWVFLARTQSMSKGSLTPKDKPPILARQDRSEQAPRPTRGAATPTAGL